MPINCLNLNDPAVASIAAKYGEVMAAKILDTHANTQLKIGVQELFDSNPELAAIGTHEQYSQYLDSIFPDSKVKDIVYHGTNKQFDKFNKSILPDSGLYFEKNKTTAYGYGNILIPAILNSSAYYYGSNLNRVNSKQIRQNGETGLTNGSGHIVFEPEQIHILGSKQDIEGFKNFVTQSSIVLPTIEQADTIYKAFQDENLSFKIAKTADDISIVKNILTNPSNLKNQNYSDDVIKGNILNSVLNNRNKDGDYYYSYGGQTTIIPKNTSRVDLMKKVEEIYNNMSNWDDTLKSKWIDFLTNKGTFEQALQYFGANKMGQSIYDEVVIDKVKNIIDFVPETGDEIMLLSDVQNKFPDLKIDTDLIGNNPIVVVHKSEDGLQELSIYDMTSKNLEPSKFNLFKKFLSNAKLKQLGITTYTDSEKGMRDFYLTLLAMSMRKANDKVRFRTLSTVQVNKTTFRQGQDIELTPSGALHELKTLIETKEGQSFIAELPEKYRKLLSEDRLLTIDYGQSYLALLKNQATKESLRDNVPSWDQNALKDMSSTIGHFLAGKGDRQEVLYQLKQRESKLRDIPEDRRNDFQKRELYMLAKAIAEQDSPKMKNKASVKDINAPAIMLELSTNQSNPIVQSFFRILNIANRRITDIAMKFVNEHDKLLKTNINDIFFSRYPEEQFKKWFVDNSNKRFERLRKKIKVLDEQGNEHMAKTMMIHFDENDITTKEAIRRGDITKEEVAYGKFIVEAFKNQMILNLEHEIVSKRNYTAIDERSAEGKAEIRKRAEEEYNKLWVDGMMPIMHKSVSGKLFSGDIKAGMSKLLKQLQNANALLDETPKSPEEQDDIVNKFMFQLGSEIDTEDKSNAKNSIGNLGNAGRLGVSYNQYSKEWTMIDPQKNNDVSDDFEMIMKYFIVSSNRKIEYDNNVIPKLNQVRTILGEEKLDKTQIWLKEITDRIIFEKGPKWFPGTTGDVSIPTPLDTDLSLGMALNASMKAGTLLTTTFNVPIALTSAALNTFTSLSTSVAQGLAGSHLYGTREWLAAMTAIAKDNGKCRALADKYHVTEMNPSDIVGNRKRQKTKQHLWSSRVFNWLNYITDYESRLHVMVAQMMKDGTWDAEVYDPETGLCTYDETKDKRFYEDGKLTKDGKLLKESLKENLVADGKMKSEDTKLTHAYDYTTARSLKDVGDQIIFGMDPETSTNLENYWLGKLPLQFRRYLPTKAAQLYSKSYMRDVTARRVVVTNPETGEDEVIMQQEYTQGKINTMLYAIKELGTLKQKPTEFWVNLQPRQKANIIKLCTDAMLATALFATYGFAGWDEDKEYKYKGRSFPMPRFKKIFQNTSRDLINDINPAFWIETWKQPIPLVGIVEQYTKVGYALMTADFKAASKSPYPLKPDIELIKETIQ
jgi:hypothetical protein